MPNNSQTCWFEKARRSKTPVIGQQDGAIPGRHFTDHFQTQSSKSYLKDPAPRKADRIGQKKTHFFYHDRPGTSKRPSGEAEPTKLPIGNFDNGRAGPPWLEALEILGEHQ